MSTTKTKPLIVGGLLAVTAAVTGVGLAATSGSAATATTPPPAAAPGSPVIICRAGSILRVFPVQTRRGCGDDPRSDS